jgi:hypothetical protein
VGPVALLLSVWTLLVEGVIAVAFLLPGRARLLRAARNVSLLTFAFSTYAIATVTGFAWILIVLGIAQCEDEDDLARFGYCMALVLVLAYALPWGAWLRGAGL